MKEVCPTVVDILHLGADDQNLRASSCVKVGLPNCVFTKLCKLTDQLNKSSEVLSES